ncbi:hypothetical protein OG568_52245 (plasmid) [Streptomyces sp. NBC_01450]|nr:hypothetical protein [Streptomyces sp. NBC_01450]
MTATPHSKCSRTSELRQLSQGQDRQKVDQLKEPIAEHGLEEPILL